MPFDENDYRNGLHKGFHDLVPERMPLDEQVQQWIAAHDPLRPAESVTVTALIDGANYHGTLYLVPDNDNNPDIS